MEAQKKKSEVNALDMARIQQQQERYHQQKLVMEQKREEYENAIKHSRAMAERERAEAEYVRRKNIELINNLKEQIEENSKRRIALEKEKYLEGSTIKQQLVRVELLLYTHHYFISPDLKMEGIVLPMSRPMRERSLKQSGKRW